MNQMVNKDKKNNNKNNSSNSLFFGRWPRTKTLPTLNYRLHQISQNRLEGYYIMSGSFIIPLKTVPFPGH